MRTFASDLRTAFRSLLRRPAFAAVAVLTLALGIGANSAIFSVVHAVLIRPLPYQDPDRLLWITSVVPAMDLEALAGADYLDWRDGSRTLDSVAAATWGSSFTLTGGEQPERIQGARVSASFLPTLGVQPARGRNFTPQEDRLNGGQVAVVSERFWQKIAGSAPFSERAVEINNESYRVVGILPRDFLYPRNPEVDILAPIALDETQERARNRMSMVQVFARLKPGATMAQVRAELKTIQDRSIAAAAAAAQADGPAPVRPPGPGGPPPGGGGGQMTIVIGGGPGPGGRGGPGGPGGPRGLGGPRPGFPETILKVMSLREHLVGDIRPALLTLLGAVGLVLLIACANVANLLLARATTRRREIAIRAALGAGRWRIVRLLLAESTVLGILGGVCGLILAAMAVRPLIALMPADLADGLFRQVPIGIDAPVLAFTLALALATGLLFGLAPALTASRPDLQDPLKEAGRGRSGVARSLLVAGEVALAVVLLVGAGLLFRSFLRLQAVDPGFRPEKILTMGVELDRTKYDSPEEQATLFRELAAQARALPGVESVSYGDSLPLTDYTMIRRGFRMEGRPPLDIDRQPEVAVTAVGPGYFETLGVRVVRGRGFEESDTATSLPVAVVDEAFARGFWGGEDPVGRRYQSGGPEAGWVTVVGVVAPVKHEGLGSTRERAALYRPWQQEPRPFGFLALRTRNEPAALASGLRQAVRSVDRSLRVYDVSTMEERLATNVADRRFNLLLLGLLAGVALALAAIGLYGVLTYTVSERTHEIGIRMALGARRETVLSLILRQGLTLVAAGIAAGLLGSLLVGRLLAASLFGVRPTDPVTFAAIAIALLAVALLSSWLPARRATRVDPTVALRQE
ncbi:MAG TPA: ABC transporter permease [Thermoanaerobaculia bacterium]|jgi:putative ABC transport system permease protein|nr:ABC transporter permease [Thermoanaerobaculia bacterium]